MNKGYPIYSGGSRDGNNDRDDLREARWNLFSANNRHLSREDLIKSFKETFKYETTNANTPRDLQHC